MYYPSVINFVNPKRLDLAVQDIYFPSTDNTQLHGWLLHSKAVKKPRGLLLHFHGNAENLTSHYLAFSWLAHLGYDVFVFDYRGYGSSEGKPSPKGLSYDADAAFNYAWDLKIKDHYEKFIVAGQSLGGSLVLKTLSSPENKDKKIDLVILDSTFRSNSALGASVLRKFWITFIFSPLSYVLLNDNYNATTADLKYWKHPTLCVVHKKDPIVPSYHTEDIFKRLVNAPKKWLWLREDEYPGHINSFFTPDGPANDKLVAFLKEI